MIDIFLRDSCDEIGLLVKSSIFASVQQVFVNFLICACAHPAYQIRLLTLL